MAQPEPKYVPVPGDARFFDTVLVDVPLLNASGDRASYELFRDLQGKPLALTNLRAPRRLPAGSKLVLNHIEVAINVWSGDHECATVLNAAGSLDLRLNDRRLYDGPILTHISKGDISTAWGEEKKEATREKSIIIRDDDDLCGYVTIHKLPWPAPEIIYKDEGTRRIEESIPLPAGAPSFIVERLKALKIVRKTTEPMFTSRRAFAQILVRVALVGELHKIASAGTALGL